MGNSLRQACTHCDNLWLLASEALPPGSHPWCALSLQGAFWGLLFGLVVGLLRMILEFCYPAPACGEEDRRPAVLKDFHYLYFALLLCGLTTIVIVAVSLCTAPIPEEKASGVLGVRPPCSPSPVPRIPPLTFTLLGCGHRCLRDGELLVLLIPK